MRQRSFKAVVSFGISPHSTPLPGAMFSGRRRGQTQNLGVLLLAWQLFSLGDRIPPLTLALVLGIPRVPSQSPIFPAHLLCQL